MGEFDKRIQMELWEEICGYFVEVTEGDMETRLYLNIGGVNKYILSPANSLQAQIISSELEGVASGAKVSILRTDIPGRPLFIRIYKIKRKMDLIECEIK